MNDQIRRGLLNLRPTLAIDLETPGDNSTFCCICQGCKTGEDCTCQKYGYNRRCGQCRAFADACAAFDWLDKNVFEKHLPKVEKPCQS